LPGEAYRDFSSYNTAIYTRGELFFQQLRYIVGDRTMHRILQAFYQKWKLKHVDETAFRSVAEEVSGQNLSTFFAQWLHSTVLYDYGIGRVKRVRQRGPEDTEAWTTQVEVVRKAEGRIPVEVGVVAGGDTSLVRTSGLADREWVTLRTLSKPQEVLLDPRVQTHDWNMLNNRKRLGISPPPPPLAPATGSDFYFHPYFSTRSRRDRMTVGLQPVAWYNDAGGVTLGFRSRDDYLGRFEQNVALLTGSTGWGVDDGVHHVDFYLRARNPTFLRAPNTSQTLDLFRVEGRFGATATVERTRRAHLTFGPTWTQSVSLQWVHPDDFRYLDPGYYDDVGTVELDVGAGVSTEAGRWELDLRGSVGGGLAYNRSGLRASGRDIDPFYPRVFVEGRARRALGARLGLAARVTAGLAGIDHAAAKQRQIYGQGADPLQRLTNPFLRSRGSLLEGEDVNYQLPGGAGVRGLDPRISTTALVGLNFELERTLRARPDSRLFSRVGLAAFTDLAQGIGEGGRALPGGELRFIGDAGIGLRAEHRIGDTRFVTRFDLPLWVSRPELAQDVSPGDDPFEFRWVFSFEPEL